MSEKRGEASEGKKKGPWGLAIERQEESYVTRGRNHEDEWDGDDVRHEVSFLSLSLVDDPLKADVVAHFEPVAGETLFVVAVTRSTGDSFSHEEGIKEALGVWRSERLARAQAAAIEDAISQGHTVAIFDEGAKEPRLEHCSWKGYFESLESVTVEALEVRSKTPRPIRARGARRR